MPLGGLCAQDVRSGSEDSSLGQTREQRPKRVQGSKTSRSLKSVSESTSGLQNRGMEDLAAARALGDEERMEVDEVNLKPSIY